MDAKELLDAGRLAAAIEQLNQEVRAHPGDPKLRTFLFEMLCFAGDYERAQRQLDVLGTLDAQAESGTIVYRGVLAAEEARMAVATENRLPAFLLEPPAFASLYLAALHPLREGNAPDDSRRGKNVQWPLSDLLRQSIYSRLAGCEDVNDAERLSHDPIFRLIGSYKNWERGAALTSG